MKLSIVADTDSDTWDEIVNSSKHSTLFHTWKFLKIMEKYSCIKQCGKYYKSTLYPIKIDDGNGTVGIIPLFYYKTPLKRIVASPPKDVECPYLGPILCNFDTLLPRKRYSQFLAFQKELDSFMKDELQANSILIGSSPGLEDSRPFTWNDYTVTPKYTNRLDLRCGEEILWNNLRSTVRRSIRKCEKNGIECAEGTRNEIELLYNNSRDADRIAVPKDYLIEIFDAFHEDSIDIHVVRYKNQFLNGAITIKHNNKAGIWIGPPKLSFNGTYPNELLLWKTIQWASRQGLGHHEIIGASDLTLFNFKNKFNSEIELFYWMKWNSPAYRVLVAMSNAIR